MQKSLIYPLLAALLLPACATRLEIQQGNVISQEKIDQLKVGMEPNQVRFLLGTPTLQDPFHPQRWDYYYSLTREGVQEREAHLRVFFEGERVARFDVSGDVPPTEFPRQETAPGTTPPSP